MSLDKRMSTLSDTLSVSDFCINPEPSMAEINQALVYAQRSKKRFTTFKQQLVINFFIDDLLDMKLGAALDNNHCCCK